MNEPRRVHALSLAVLGILLALSHSVVSGGQGGVSAPLLLGLASFIAGILAIRSGDPGILATGLSALAAGAAALALSQWEGLAPSTSPAVALAALATVAAALLVSSGLLEGTPRIAAAIFAAIVVPLLVYYGIQFYPWLSGYSLVLATAGVSLSFYGRGQASHMLSTAGLAGVFDPLLSGVVVVTGGAALAVLSRGSREVLLESVGPLLLASSIALASLYPVAGPVAAVTGLVFMTLRLSRWAPESVMPGLALGVVLYIIGLRSGLSPVASAALFMAGSGIGLAYRAIRSKGWALAPIAATAIIVALSAPLAAPLVSAECPVRVISYNYGAADKLVLTGSEDALSQYYPIVERFIAGTNDTARLATLTVLDPEVPGRVTAPGILENITMRDIASNANITLSVGPEDFLLLPFNTTLTVFFAVDTEDMLLRAAARLPSIIIPRTILGDLRPDPVHTVLTVNFSAPLMITLPGRATLVVYQAVIASSFVAGGPKTSAFDTPLGVEWTNVTLGVVRGTVVYQTGSLSIPMRVNQGVANAMDTYLRTKSSDPAGALVISTYARLLLEGHEPSSGERAVPRMLWVNATTSAGEVNHTLTYTGNRYLQERSHAQFASGPDYLVVTIAPSNASFSNISAPYLKALGAYKALENGGPLALAATATILGERNPADTASIAWAATHLVPMDPHGPEPSVECYRIPMGVIALLAPFLVAPAAASWLRGSRPPR